MSKRYFSLAQCANSIEHLADIANKRRMAPRESELELLNEHCRQIVAMLRDPAQSEAISIALLRFRGQGQ